MVELVCDPRMMERQMREIGFDTAKMPLGKLKKETLMQVETCLDSILVPSSPPPYPPSL